MSAFRFPANEQIRTALVAALEANRTYIRSTPTAADNTAQLKALTLQVNQLIRLVDHRLDAAD